MSILSRVCPFDEMMNPLVPIPKSTLQVDENIRSGKRVAIYGSTGSIGATALQFLEQCRELKVAALFANASVDLFVEQVKKYKPDFAGLVDATANAEAKSQLAGVFNGTWLGSADEIHDFAVSSDYDTQLSAVVGVEGFQTSFPAYSVGKRVALANKESLVVGGEFFRREKSAVAAGELIPVDSEHSSLFRLLQTLEMTRVKTIGLTASGGPFYKLAPSELHAVTVEDALSHPTWNMGARITIDSASLMNKAFELVEAKWLFDLDPEKIEVKIHPQSVIHGFIQCVDGTHFMHASPPDMAFPIAYALKYPHIPFEIKPPFEGGSLELLSCDEKRFRAISLARQVAQGGIGESVRFYTANEQAVSRFLKRELPFNKIVEFVEYSLEKGGFQQVSRWKDLYGAVEAERETISEFLLEFTRRSQ